MNFIIILKLEKNSDIEKTPKNRRKRERMKQQTFVAA